MIPVPREGTVAGIVSCQLRCSDRSLGGIVAYDWYDFVLDCFREGYYVEETGEVELWVSCQRG